MFEKSSKHPRTNVYLTKPPVLPGLTDESEALIEKPHSAFAPPANTVASLSAGAKADIIAKAAKAVPVKLKARKK